MPPAVLSITRALNLDPVKRPAFRALVDGVSDLDSLNGLQHGVFTLATVIVQSPSPGDEWLHLLRLREVILAEERPSRGFVVKHDHLKRKNVVHVISHYRIAAA